MRQEIGLAIVVGMLVLSGLPWPVEASGEAPVWSPGDYWEFTGWDGTLGVQANYSQRTEVLGMEEICRNASTFQTVKLLQTETLNLWWMRRNATATTTLWFRTADRALLRERIVFEITPGNQSIDATIEYLPS